MTDTIPVVMDVDTGIDDAFALLYAARDPRIDLLGVSCVDGNTTVDNVVSNTLTVLDIAGGQGVPVARGAERPLLADPCYADMVHGRDGLGDLGLARSTRRPDPRHAVTFLRETILGSPRPVVLVATGPLTNIALLVRTHPQVRQNLERIVVMSGAMGPGNATALAEFNAWHDPEAAAIVFGYDVPLTMYGLDVFRDLRLTPAHHEALAQSAQPAAILASRLARHNASGSDAPIAAPGPATSPAAMPATTAAAPPLTTDAAPSATPSPFATCLGDYGAIAVAVDASHCTIERHAALVLTTAGQSRGQTIIDRRPRGNLAEGDSGLSGGREIGVVTAIDVPYYTDHWLETLIRD